MNRRVGILGGTFDPIHCGHLDLGAAAQAALKLSPLFVIPANVPPHRPAPVASGFHRFAMVALAIAGKHDWQASDLELERGEPSYTSTTLSHLHARDYSPAELFFVIGADAFREIDSWKDYPHILDGAHFAVVSRPGYSVSMLPQQLPDLASRMVSDPTARGVGAEGSIILIDVPTADVSATAIRERCAEHLSIAGLVAPEVAQHIEQHGLYTSTPTRNRAHARPASASAGRLHGQS